jgi:uncharacterized protein YegP (UPF0339 family)
MAGNFVLKNAVNGQYMFNLEASNGEIILTSETYHSKDGAKNGIASVKTHSPYDRFYEKKYSYNNQPYFVLKASNGEIIGKSEMYSTEQACAIGIQSVKSNAPTANIVDVSN